MITYQIEDYETFVPEAMELFKKHAEEMKEALKVDFELDVGHYERLFYLGELLFLTARENGVMVGYQVIRIAAHNRSKNTKIAQEEALFLLPEYRKGQNGQKLLQLGAEAARHSGAEKYYVTSQEAKPISSLLLKVGFKKKAEVYVMELEPVDG